MKKNKLNLTLWSQQLICVHCQAVIFSKLIKILGSAFRRFFFVLHVIVDGTYREAAPVSTVLCSIRFKFPSLEFCKRVNVWTVECVKTSENTRYILFVIDNSSIFFLKVVRGTERSLFLVTHDR